MKYLLFLVIAIALTAATYFMRSPNPLLCTKSNMMSQGQLIASNGHRHGYPLHFLSDTPWICNQAGETGRDYQDFQGLHDAENFAADVIVWFSLIFTAYSLWPKGKVRR